MEVVVNPNIPKIEFRNRDAAIATAANVAEDVRSIVFIILVSQRVSPAAPKGASLIGVR